MFRKMRLEDNMTTKEEAEKMFQQAPNGVLAVLGDESYPYAVPLSFAYENGKIFFHGTTADSHKIDSIKKNPQVSFCVVVQDHILPDQFNTLYKSAIAFGKARILTDAAQAEAGMHAILRKYSSAHMEAGKAYMSAEEGNFCVVEIDVEHLTGKIGK